MRLPVLALVIAGLMVGVGRAEAATPMIHVPSFTDTVPYAQTAVFWFGEVGGRENYVDVRVGRTEDSLWANIAVVDRILTYDPTPLKVTLTDYDAVSLYLEVPTGQGGFDRYRFDGQLYWWESPEGFTQGWKWNGAEWEQVTLTYTYTAGWRGNAPNDAEEDRGWQTTFTLPWEGFGITEVGGVETIKAGVVVHDLDGSLVDTSSWPEQFTQDDTTTWGEWRLQSGDYAPEAHSSSVQEVLIREGQGLEVNDAPVGGNTTCGGGMDYWTEWGLRTYPQTEQVNVQNQRDIADWPCFSKFVASFPLGQIPAGKVVVEAAVTLHQFGNAGGGEWGEPPPSYMSASLLEAAIDEETVSWNSTPGVAETGPVVLVQPMSGPVVWPGVAWQWDVSRLLASAYTQGKNSLDLVWYSADAAYHTGKYFTSSETGDWNVAGRPALLVRFADELDDWQLVDFNVNGRVDIFDLSYLIEGWGGLGCEWIVDVTGDCVVDVRDWWRGLEFFGRPY